MICCRLLAQSKSLNRKSYLEKGSSIIPPPNYTYPQKPPQHRTQDLHNLSLISSHFSHSLRVPTRDILVVLRLLRILEPIKLQQNTPTHISLSLSLSLSYFLIFSLFLREPTTTRDTLVVLLLLL